MKNDNRKQEGYDAEFWDPVIKAAEGGDLKRFGRLLDDADKIPVKKDINEYDDEFWTPLMHAVEDGDMVRFEAFVSAGADVNKGDMESETYPITLAAEHGREEMFFRLVELGAKLNVDEYCCPTCDMWYGFRPADLFVYAASSGNVRIARYLRFMGVRPWSTTRSMHNAGRRVRELVPAEFMEKVFSKRELASKKADEGLFDILGWEAIRECGGIHWTHYSGYWPEAVNLPKEVRRDNDRRILTARACYALRLWELARRACVAKGIDADAQSKWTAFGKGLWRIRYSKDGRFDDWDLFVSTMREEMRRIADSGELVVHVGANKPLPGPVYGGKGAPEDYVIPDSPGKTVGDWSIEAIKGLEADYKDISFRWSEIWEAFSSLTDMQVAFLNADSMPDPTGADADFLDACERLDVQAMEDALSRGADVYAVSHGDSAAVKIADGVLWARDNDHPVPDAERLLLARRAFQCLLDHGGNLDFVGLGEESALHATVHGGDEFVGMLLELGADANAPCWFSNGGPIETALDHAHDDWNICAMKYIDYPKMIRSLCRAGAMCVIPQILDDKWCLEDVDSDDRAGAPEEHFPDGIAPRDRPLLQAVRRGYEFISILAARWGANPAMRDERGRSLVRIFVEDHAAFCPRRDRCSQDSMANYMLFLLNGLRVPVDRAEVEAIAESCRQRRYYECLAELERWQK